MDKDPPRYDRERPVTWLLAFLTFCASMGGAAVTQSATKGNAIIALSDKNFRQRLAKHLSMKQHPGDLLKIADAAEPRAGLQGSSETAASTAGDGSASSSASGSDDSDDDDPSDEYMGANFRVGDHVSRRFEAAAAEYEKAAHKIAGWLRLACSDGSGDATSIDAAVSIAWQEKGVGIADVDGSLMLDILIGHIAGDDNEILEQDFVDFRQGDDVLSEFLAKFLGFIALFAFVGYKIKDRQKALSKKVASNHRANVIQAASFKDAMAMLQTLVRFDTADALRDQRDDNIARKAQARRADGGHDHSDSRNSSGRGRGGERGGRGNPGGRNSERGGGGSGRNSTFACFNCGEAGHKAQDCPKSFLRMQGKRKAKVAAKARKAKALAEEAAARTAEQESDDECDDEFVHLPAEPRARRARDDSERDADFSDDVSHDGHGEQMAVGFSAQSLIALMILVLALCAKLTLQCVTPFPKQGTENQTVPSAMLVVNTSKMVQDFTEFGINDMRGNITTPWMQITPGYGTPLVQQAADSGFTMRVLLDDETAFKEFPCPNRSGFCVGVSAKHPNDSIKVVMPQSKRCCITRNFRICPRETGDNQPGIDRWRFAPGRYGAPPRPAENTQPAIGGVLGALGSHPVAKKPPGGTHGSSASDKIDPVADCTVWKATPKDNMTVLQVSRWLKCTSSQAYLEYVKTFKMGARMCGRGDRECKHRDYDPMAISAMPVRFSSVLMCFAIAAELGLGATSIDFSTAYVNAPNTNPNVWVRVPAGIQGVPTIGRDGQRRVARAQHSLFGFEGSGAARADLLDTKLRSLGGLKPAAGNAASVSGAASKGLSCIPCKSDPNVYRYDRGGEVCIICAYSDDCLIFSSCQKLRNDIVESLKEFKLRDDGAATGFLGMKIEKKVSSDGALAYKLSMPGYTKRLLEDNLMHEANPVSRPVSPSERITDAGTECKDAEQVRKCIGSLLWAAVTVRPDILSATNVLCRQMHCPTPQTAIGAKRVCRFLKGTIDRGMHFSCKTTPSLKNQKTIGFSSYTDADWGDDVDTGRSTSGHVLMMDGAAFANRLRLEKPVAMSSGESEAMAMCGCVQEIDFYRDFLGELKLGNPAVETTLYVDNMSAVLDAHNTTGKRTRHINLLFHRVRQSVRDKTVRVLHVRGGVSMDSLQVADVHTKATNTPLFKKFSANIMGETGVDCERLPVRNG